MRKERGATGTGAPVPAAIREPGEIEENVHAASTGGAGHWGILGGLRSQQYEERDQLKIDPEFLHRGEDDNRSNSHDEIG